MEWARILRFIAATAAAHPSIRFTLCDSARATIALSTPSVGEPLEVLQALAGVKGGATLTEESVTAASVCYSARRGRTSISGVLLTINGRACVVPQLLGDLKKFSDEISEKLANNVILFVNVCVPDVSTPLRLFFHDFRAAYYFRHRPTAHSPSSRLVASLILSTPPQACKPSLALALSASKRVILALTSDGAVASPRASPSSSPSPRKRVRPTPEFGCARAHRLTPFVMRIVSLNVLYLIRIRQISRHASSSRRLRRSF